MRIPEAYQEADIAKVMGVIREAVKGFPLKGIFILGNTGVGKTYSAWAIAKEVDKSVHHVEFVNLLSELPDLAYDMYSHSKDRDTNRYYRIMNMRGLLVLDDMSADIELSSREKRVLLAMIDRYVNENLPIIITSNNTLEEIEAFYGIRTVSRIVGKCTTIKIDDSVSDIRQHGN